MRFGIDLDGVIANFGARVIDAANVLWPGKLPPSFVPDNWDYVGTFTKADWDAVWAQIKSTPYFWEDEPTLPGLQDLTDYLVAQCRENTDPVNPAQRDEIFFITARLRTKGAPPLVQSSHWLQIHGLWPRDGYSAVIPVAKAEHKKQLFQGLGLKLMLDDYAPTVKELNEIEGMHAFVLDQPWNRYATELPRVYSVAEYLDTIKNIKP